MILATTSMPRLSVHSRAGWVPVLLVLMMAAIPAVEGRAGAEIYGYQDAEGFWRLPSYSHQPREGSTRSQGSGEDRVPIEDYEGIIRGASEKFGVDNALIKAVIKAESDFRRGAVSSKGAQGLMQLMPSTRAKMGVGNPFNPRANIYGGTRYLADLLERFGQDKALALAAYNAGAEKVAACGGIPPIPETRTFVLRVMEYYQRFKFETQ